MKGHSLKAKLPVSEIGNRGSNPLILEFTKLSFKKNMESLETRLARLEEAFLSSGGG